MEPSARIRHIVAGSLTSVESHATIGHFVFNVPNIQIQNYCHDYVPYHCVFVSSSNSIRVMLFDLNLDRWFYMISFDTPSI